MTPAPQNAAVLWTGGKDSALALHEAGRSGCRVRCLLTFASPRPQFLAHPLPFLRLQARALGLPHHLWPVREPLADGYEAGLRWLRDEMGIDAVITGDIAEVGGAPNWIRERNRGIGLNVVTPLWGRDRLALLQELLGKGFKVLFSCVKAPWFTAAWVGRELAPAAIEELKTIRARTGLDLCGEQGEYHTLVTDGPPFGQRLQICSSSKRAVDSLVHLKIHRVKLTPKTGDI